MKDSIFIICDRNGVKGLRKSKPKLNSGEVAVRLEIEVPTEYFDRFIPTVKVTLPEPSELSDVLVGFDERPVEHEEEDVDPLDSLFEEDEDEETFF